MKSIREVFEAWQDNNNFTFIDLAAQDDLIRTLEAREIEQPGSSRESLAAYAHSAWAGWMRYLFSQCVGHEGEIVIPVWAVERWSRQIETAYQELSEAEKESDRAEADKMLKIVNAECARLRAALEELSLQVCADVQNGIGDLVEVEKIIRAALAKEREEGNE